MYNKKITAKILCMNKKPFKKLLFYHLYCIICMLLLIYKTSKIFAIAYEYYNVANDGKYYNKHN